MARTKANEGDKALDFIQFEGLVTLHLPLFPCRSFDSQIVRQMSDEVWPTRENKKRNMGKERRE